MRNVHRFGPAGIKATDIPNLISACEELIIALEKIDEYSLYSVQKIVRAALVRAETFLKTTKEKS